MLLRILLFAALAWALWRLIRGLTGGSIVQAAGGGGGRSKCADCRHARKVFDDGTLCTFGGREVFKKPVHVSNCTDHTSR